MRQFQTVVLDFKFAYTASFTTHPIECAWASEAIFFLRVEAMEGAETSMRARVQFSVDGVTWLDEGSGTGEIRGLGNSFVRVSHFGGFLRLACDLAGEDASVTVTTNLVLKE